MLYVFHVDAGLMTTYDMNLTLQSVASLRAAIERKTKIPATSLVLLVSGGEVLQSDHMVSSYSAGTDTNPIYMFSKPSVKESHLKQSMCDLSPIVELSTGEFRSDTRSGFDGKSVAELRNAVEVCCSLPTNVNTVISCAALAQQFSDLAHEVSKSCDQLVHEQHLQHQGWAAVVANLEDIFNEFNERSRRFKESFKKHRLKKDEYHEKLVRLSEVLQSLGQIPILPALQSNAEAHRFSAFDVFEETDIGLDHYGVSQPLSRSSGIKTQDFGTAGVFKFSDEDVFENKNASTSHDVEGLEGIQRVEESDEEVPSKETSCESKEEPTLLHWILAQGNKASLQDILDYCRKGLALIDAEPLKEHEAELYHILEYAKMHGLKQIKGIEDRLYGLDQLLSNAKKLERDQHDQAASLIQYRERLNSTCDPSILSTLVQSHWCQLEKLLKGHQELVDIRRRIAKSKDELSHILKARLEAVLMIENSMSVQDAHAMLSFQCFNRLARYFGIVAQLHRAPAVFVRAVHEVARRRSFSTAHLEWATDLAEKLQKIHEEEVLRRQEFNALFEDHFLKSLFPGMTDLPPQFATQAPPIFDAKLPQLSEADVEFVSKTFPELSNDIPKHDMGATVKFFKQRLNASDHEEKDVDVQVDFDKDFESMNDTDFERVSQQSSSQKKIDVSTTCVPVTMAVSTVTEVRTLPVIVETLESPNEEFVDSEFYIEESLPSSLEWGRGERQDNMEVQRINIEKLRELLIKLSSLCRVNILLIKEELVNLRREIDEQNKYMFQKHLDIKNAWEKSNEETEIRFREHTQRLTVDHELELSDMKAALNEKDETIHNLKRDLEVLKADHQKEIDKLKSEQKHSNELLEKAQEEIKSFEKKLEELELSKQKVVKETQEKMHLEYKAEIESLRSRFRLVALTNNMDRSPSESSLEKIERTDVIEISSHNAIIMQTKENAELEKEEAVRLCKEEWEQKLNAEILLLKSKYEAEKQVVNSEATRRLLAEKDRQVELAREREAALARECAKYRATIQQLADPDTNVSDTLLQAQFATLENEKSVLVQQIADLKKEIEKKSEESDKSKEEDSEGRLSPKKEVSRRSRCHTPLGLAGGSLSLSSCLPGHSVLLLWDPAHHNYTVMQESTIMYFVHSDCLPALDLSIQVKSESERKLYAIATVESKEYCYAKKTGNRYHMPRGSRFYRVRVKPLRPHLPAPACCDTRHRGYDSESYGSSRIAISFAGPAWYLSRQIKDAMKGSMLSVLGVNRPPKKWLTYVHAPDAQKSVDTSQSTSSNTDEPCRVTEVATATLINLESPVSTGEGPSNIPIASEDQLDSIESTDQWHNAEMTISTSSDFREMECSVGRCPGPEPLELAGSAADGAAPAEELAEEAAP